MTIENMVDYSRKRTAITWALNELKDIIGNVKISKDKGSPTFSVLVDGILQDFDIFYQYGSDCFIRYAERNTKGVVTKVRLKSRY